MQRIPYIIKKKAIEHSQSLYDLIFIKKEPVTFLLGAGISIAPPSNAPSWARLRDNILQAIIERGVNSPYMTNQIFKELSLHCKKHNVLIKPELLLQWLYSDFQEELFTSLKVTNNGTPNINHLVLAFLGNLKNVLLCTTNFDQYLEKAFEQLYPKERLKVYADIRQNKNANSYRLVYKKKPFAPLIKLHGSLENLETIQATLRQVSKPVPNSFRRLIEKIIAGRNVIVMGYSGNDYDLYPLLFELSLEARSMQWFSYYCYDDIKDGLKKNTDIKIYKTDINQILMNLGKKINLPFIILKEPFNKNSKMIESIDTLKQWASNLSESRCIYSICKFAMHIGAFDVSNKLAIELIKKSRLDNIQIARAYNIIGINHKRINPKKAMFFYKKAEHYACKVQKEHPILYGNIAGNIGVVYHEIGIQGKAKQWLSISNLWAKEAKSFFLMAANNDDLGNVFRAMKQYGTALKHYRKAERFRKKIGDLIGLALTLNNIGLTYLELNKLDLAQKYISQSLKIKEDETSDIPALIRGRINLAEILIKKNNLDNAIVLLDKAYADSKSLKDILAKTRIEYNLALINFYQGRIGKCRIYFRLANKSFQKHKWNNTTINPIWVTEINKKILF